MNFFDLDIFWPKKIVDPEAIDWWREDQVRHGKTRDLIAANESIGCFYFNKIYCTTITSMTQPCSNFRCSKLARRPSLAWSNTRPDRRKRINWLLLVEQNKQHKCSTVTSMIQSCSNFRWPRLARRRNPALLGTRPDMQIHCIRSTKTTTRFGQTRNRAFV